MKYFIPAAILFLFACAPSNQPPPTNNYEVIYEVKTSSGTWFGEYFNESGARLYTNDPDGTVHLMPSGWTYTFRPRSIPFDLMCHASSTCICHGTPSSPDVTVNLYVNGALVKSETSNWAKGVTTAVYRID